jgi:hypothetical protein
MYNQQSYCCKTHADYDMIEDRAAAERLMIANRGPEHRKRVLTDIAAHLQFVKDQQIADGSAASQRARRRVATDVGAPDASRARRT